MSLGVGHAGWLQRRAGMEPTLVGRRRPSSRCGRAGTGTLALAGSACWLPASRASAAKCSTTPARKVTEDGARLFWSAQQHSDRVLDLYARVRLILRVAVAAGIVGVLAWLLT
jgi:hypothetical protein